MLRAPGRVFLGMCQQGLWSTEMLQDPHLERSHWLNVCGGIPTFGSAHLREKGASPPQALLRAAEGGTQTRSFHRRRARFFSREDETARIRIWPGS